MTNKLKNTSEDLHLPGMVPRLELSKNCLGQVLDSRSKPAPASKNLLLGESSSFLGESSSFLGVTRNFLGELTRLVESELIGRPLLVGVQGDEGMSTSGLLFTFSFMALFFHLLISACWLDTKLHRQEDSCQNWTKSSHTCQIVGAVPLKHWKLLPFQLSYFQPKLFDFLLQFGLLQQNAALHHQASWVGQSGVKVLTLQD